MHVNLLNSIKKKNTKNKTRNSFAQYHEEMQIKSRMLLDLNATSACTNANHIKL